MSEWVTNNLGPILEKIFQPIDMALTGVYMPWAKLVALAYFIGTMIWVFTGLRKEYVNLEAPSQHIWHDLRFWTVISMTPHVIVYLYL